MNLLALFTTFNGRISRKPWWIGSIIWISVSLFGAFLLHPKIFTAEQTPLWNWRDTIWNLACLIPLTALTVKRFNDRDRPWWFGYALSAVFITDIGASHFGFDLNPEVGGIRTIAFWAVAAIGLFALIDNGFLRGTDGPNRYGPAPLAHTT